ncbi:MAG TPA: hypothetical protein VJT14_06845 [Candidatus Dormibacteraeota bacterium]|nr:hypothetical protein [Candidatus Dormibacteraeota bacterium]
MSGFTGVAGHRALSMGTLLIVGAALALYQMTSLVLGPGGSRQLHLSLMLPAADAAERTESWASSGKLALGMLVAPAPAGPAWTRSVLAHRASSTPAGYVAPAPVVAPVPFATPVPVTSPLPAPHPSGPPAPHPSGPPSPHPSGPPSPPIVRGGPDPQPGTRQPDESD